MTTYQEHLIREADGVEHRGQKQCPGCGEWFKVLSYEGEYCSHECYEFYQELKTIGALETMNEDDWTEDR